MNLQDDKVARFIEACYQAGIKDAAGFLVSKMPQVYWWLRGAFPRGVLPTDIDGLVEINNRFLLLEFKHESVLHNGQIPKGQMILATALVRSGYFHVMFVGTDDAHDVACVQVVSPKSGWRKVERVNRDWVYETCKRWSMIASESTFPAKPSDAL